MPQAKPRNRHGIRLYVPQPFGPGGHLTISQPQQHYLAQVMRCVSGDVICVFNGGDGEWQAGIEIGRKEVSLCLLNQRAPQRSAPDAWLAFAPVKQRTDMIVEKAVELGAVRLLPVITQRSILRSVNREKMLAHAIEAAEQSQRHDVPEVEEAQPLDTLLGKWPAQRPLLFADESGSGDSLTNVLDGLTRGPFGVLTGPEGGFSPEERRMLAAASFVRPFSMGPRILRADTAVIAALVCMQSRLGDWDEKPNFTPGET